MCNFFYLQKLHLQVWYQRFFLTFKLSFVYYFHMKSSACTYILFHVDHGRLQASEINELDAIVRFTLEMSTRTHDANLLGLAK